MSPSMYYPETVVFVLDACEDPGAEPSKNAARLELIKQCIGMFAQAKSRVNPAHKYGLAVIRDAITWEGHGVSASPEGLMAALRNVQPAPVGPAVHPPLDLGALVALIQPLAVAEEADGARVRVILVYCRSTVVPVWTTHYRPEDRLCLDVLFVHDKAAATAVAATAGPDGCPSPQDVYSWLEDNVDVLSGRCQHNAYIFEAGGHIHKKITNLMVSLLAHPAQRPSQRDLCTAPLDLAAMPPQPTSATVTVNPLAAAAAAGGGGGSSGGPLDASAFPPLPSSLPAAAGTSTLPLSAPGSAWGTPAPAPAHGHPDPTQQQHSHSHTGGFSSGAAAAAAAAGGGGGGGLAVQYPSLQPQPLLSPAAPPQNPWPPQAPTADLIEMSSYTGHVVPPPPPSAAIAVPSAGASPPPYWPSDTVPAAVAGAAHALSGMSLGHGPYPAAATGPAAAAVGAVPPSLSPADGTTAVAGGQPGVGWAAWPEEGLHGHPPPAFGRAFEPPTPTPAAAAAVVAAAAHCPPGPYGGRPTEASQPPRWPAPPTPALTKPWDAPHEA